MELILKGKSIQRVDNTSSEEKKTKGQKLAESLGVQNFSGDLRLEIDSLKSITKETNLSKAGTAHIPIGSFRCAYTPVSERGTIYIPVNRLKQVYQTDKATNMDKVHKLVKLMKEGKPLPPVQIGYNYDVHDGHHRWEATKLIGYSHVPCEVIGTDKEKIAKAKQEYRKVWKCFVLELMDDTEILLKSDRTKVDLLKSDILMQLNDNLEDEIKAIDMYEKLLKVTDPVVTPIIEDILGDEKDHFINLSLILRYIKKEITIEEVKSQLRKSLNLAVVLDLQKGGKLNRGKLVRKRVPVTGKNGKTFYRMQWVDPTQDVGGEQHGEKEESTYHHDDSEISNMEREQRNKFPVGRMSVDDISIDTYGYKPDQSAIAEAIKKYHNGDKLPPVMVRPDGTVITGYQYYEMAKKLGLSHIPVIVQGNTNLKQELDNKLREQVFEEDEESKEVIPLVNGGHQPIDTTNLDKEIVGSLERFRKVTSKQYTKQYLMEQAEKQGIEWNKKTKDGTDLPMNSAILWMRASEAISKHIASGGDFQVEQNKKDMKASLKHQGKDPIQGAFLQVMDKFKGSKQNFMEWMIKNGNTWQEHKDPDINWMTCVKEAKKILAQGKMLAGVRVRNKEAMEEANLQITDQIKQQVKNLGKKHGKANVMERADTLGIAYNKHDKKGNPYPQNSAILWMNAHMAISRYIAQGNQFLMEGESAEQGLAATLNKEELPKWSRYAMNWATRNSETQEKSSKKYGISCFMTDGHVTEEQATQMYNQFVENARKAKLMIRFDPLEMLPNGISLIEQMCSSGRLDNNYTLGRGGLTKEHMESVDMYLFDDEYTANVPDADRPVFGCIDLYNAGLGNGSSAGFHLGEVSFVLKDDVKKRSTGTFKDSNNIQYGEEGKWTKPLEDPHQLLLDRWRSKWSKPHKANGQRKRAMDAVVNGTTHTDDKEYFEAQIHGAVDLNKDIDYLAVPSAWQTNSNYKESHEKIQNLAGLFGISIKYE